MLRIKQFIFQFLNTIVAFGKVFFFAKFKVKLPEIKAQSCVILGNGPSLNESIEHHADFMKNKDIFCVNLFATSSYYKQLKPNNYLLLDEAFLDPNHSRASRAVQHLIKDTDWELNLFVSNKFRKSDYFQTILSQNKYLKPVYFNYVIVDGFDSVIFKLFKVGLAMPRCQNVLVASIFQCINLGYQTVNLLGADHTWHENIRINKDNELEADDAHFYGTKTYIIKDIMQNNESYLARQFLSLHKAFKGYEVLARYATYTGTKVLNASQRSYIDVFEKINLSNGFTK